MTAGRPLRGERQAPLRDRKRPPLPVRLERLADALRALDDGPNHSVFAVWARSADDVAQAAKYLRRVAHYNRVRRQ